MKTLSISQLNFKNQFNLVTPCSELPFDSSVYLRFINKNFSETMSFNEFELPQTSRGIGGNPRIRMEDRRDAVLIKNASKKYGKDSTACTVLSDLNMCVKEGTIYTLLGSSGCGKTTLLSCIVGTTQLDDGECKIFGLKPGTKECGIPGKNVGFMPQEIALYGEFTIEEAMHFFGTVNGMSNDKIKNRMVFLKKFLNLPSSERQVRNLSGGQQRRVSFAVALLHQPKILILDEPTVGVDPMLRKSIWRHLTDLVESGKTTVIITTHYIEEATGAHRIGLMRNGRLLAEDSPKNLLATYGCHNLDEVFFNLCQQDRPVDEDGIENSSETRGTVNDDAERLESADSGLSLNTISDSGRIDVAYCNERNIVKPNNINDHAGSETPKDKNFNTGTGIPKPDHCPPFPAVVPKYHENLDNVEITERTLKHEAVGYMNRMRALLWKNFICMWRNIGFVFFIFCLPAVQAVLFCTAIGGQPTDLPLGVVNLEVANSAECMTSTGCSISNMSCNFLKLIDNKTLTLNYFDGERMALEAVKKGNVWGYLVIPANFSAAVLQAGVDMVKQKEDSFLGTHVKLALDMTSQQIGFTIQHTLSMSFEQFNQDLSQDCGFNYTIDLPKSLIAEPIYGSINSNFREFMAPGIILSIIFFMSVALTGSAFITERKEGMLNRMLVSGVSTGEIITAHMLTQYIIMAGQTVLVLAVMIVWFKVDVEGSVPLAVVLTLVQGTCGMAYGFLISCVCTEERNAIQMALGSFYPNLLLSGVVWPFESMESGIRLFATFLPQTLACEAMRSIFSRGWEFTHPKVWPGFLSSMIWSILFWSIALILARFRKK